MTKKVIIIIAVVLLSIAIISCGSPEPEKIIKKVTVEVEVTKIITEEVPVTVIVTREVPVTVVITKEVVVTATPTPTLKPTATPETKPIVTPTDKKNKEGTSSENQQNKFALNELGTYTSDGIELTIRRVLCEDRQLAEKELGGNFDEIPGFGTPPVVCELIYEVRNTSNQMLSFFPDQGTIQINDELVKLTDYMFAVIDDASGEIPPGVMLIGTQWFGVKRNSIPDIRQMIWRIDGPVDEGFNSTGSDFEITIDLSEHRIDKLQDDLRP